MQAEYYDVIIIGSGVGGLGSGLYLQKMNPNLRTLILEQHSIPGGSVNGFKRKGYYFDSGAEGLVYCGEGQIFRQRLEEVGVFQEFISIDPVEVMKYQDRTVVMHNKLEKFIDELIHNFPDEEEEIRNYFEVIKKMSDEYFSLNIDSLTPSFRTLLRIVFTRPTLRKYGTKTFQKLLDKFITNPELRKILVVYCLWLGVLPDKISAPSAAVVFNSPFIDGNFYPKGGMLAFAKNMVNTFKLNGGEIKYKSKVDKILFHKKKAVGVRLTDGRIFYGKWIISNADLRRTVFDFVGKDFFKKSYQKFISKIKQSVTGFAVFLGLDIHLDDHHSHIAYNVDAEKFLERLETDNFDPEEVLIRIPQNIDPSLRNDKGSSVILLSMAPYDYKKKWGVNKEEKRNGTYHELKEVFANKLIKLAEKVIPDLTQRIKVKEIATPLTFERYIQSTEGSWYGPETNQKLPSYKSPLKRLLFAGGNVDGAGVPPSFFSGIKTAKYITRKMKKKRNRKVVFYSVIDGQRVAITAPLPDDKAITGVISQR
ncbi:MAG: NAD(P)/FAD-dependent oxidoreductase [Candidatus Heimdallarchaeota archaeon]|nr:NAD(P)/FAD-dependent oxidoreductase [Candidatus Heimdallarchaeota archaeon]MCK4771148.1 NAD(P)/FAD-dependent oxidoreductase [Candidatus Heimdallarchaeota archaeon]